MSLENLVPILSNPNITFVDLQYGDTEKEKKIIFERYNIEIKSISDVDNFNDLDGLASINNACDYIITKINSKSICYTSLANGARNEFDVRCYNKSKK
jgi:DNA-directed RNA polymerase